MKSSARNQFTGKVTSVIPGPVNAEVELSLDSGDRIVSVVTNIDADHMETYGHDFARLKQAFASATSRSNE